MGDNGPLAQLHLRNIRSAGTCTKKAMNHQDKNKPFTRERHRQPFLMPKGPSNEEEIIWPRELFVVFGVGFRTVRIVDVSRMSFLIRHASRVPVL